MFVTFLRVRWFNCKDLVRTIFHYWRNFFFFQVDSALLAAYFFQSPYRLVRIWTKGKEPYGETPLVTMDLIATRAKISPQDVVYELGAGRGRVAFWLAIWIGCKTIAVENVPIFVQKAERIAKKFQIPNVTFCLADMLEVDVTPATVIYLFGTCLADEEIIRFIEKLHTVRKGTTVITISYPLTSYTKDKHLLLIDEVEVLFSWGKTHAYIHKII